MKESKLYSRFLFLRLEILHYYKRNNIIQSKGNIYIFISLSIANKKN